MTIADRAITGLRRLLDGLLFGLVAVSLGVVVLGRLVPLAGHQTLVVAGPSMGAAVPIGAAIVLDPVPAARLAVGDVVTLRSGPDRAIFTHRIVRLAEHDGGLWLETKGDANAAPDPSLSSADAVLGRVGLWIPYAGYLLTLYSAPSGIIFVVSLGMVLLLLGISLEPRSVRGRVTTGADEPGGAARPTTGLTLAAASDAPVAMAERPSTNGVARASRERRARRTIDGSARSRRRPGA